MITASMLDRVVTLAHPTTTTDDYGAPTQSWTVYATMRAQLVERSLKEAMLTGYGKDTDVLTAFRIRWLDGVTENDQLTYNGQTFRIQEIAEIGGRREALELRCLAVTNQ